VRYLLIVSRDGGVHHSNVRMSLPAFRWVDSRLQADPMAAAWLERPAAAGR
jgi:hypothetical protein